MNQFWLSTWRLCLLVILSWCLAACQATRFVGENEVLLKADPVMRHQGELSDEQVENAVRTQANRRMLLPKTALHTYNFGRRLERRFRSEKPPIGPGEEVSSFGGKVIRLLKYRWGEPPVLLDTARLTQDLQNLRNLYFAHGYFHPELSYEIDTLYRRLPRRRSKRKAKVTFTIREGIPQRIREIALEVADSSEIDPLILNAYDNRRDSILLRPGDRYEHDRFEQERQRGAYALRSGFFAYFSPSDIRFLVDTAVSLVADDPLQRRFPDSHWFDLTIQITGRPITYNVPEIVVNIHAPPRPSGQPDPKMIELRASELTEAVRDSLGVSREQFNDTLPVVFRVDPSLVDRIDYNFLAERIKFIEEPQSFGYRQHLIDYTQRNLQKLGMVQYMLINFRPLPDRPQQLQAEIDLHIAPQYRIKVGAEAFTRDITSQNTTFLPSVGGNLGFRNRNAFKKSELFEFTLSGSLGLLNQSNRFLQDKAPIPELGPQVYYQFGTSAEITFPRFLLSRLIRWFIPPKMEANLDKYNPVTTLSASGNYERFGEEFQQLAPGAQLTYKWRNHRTKYLSAKRRTQQTSQFSPISITFIAPSINIDLGPFADVEAGSLINLGNRQLDDLSEEVLSLPPLLYQDFQPRLSSRLQIRTTLQNYRATRERPTFWFQTGLEIGGNAAAVIEDFAAGQGWETRANDSRLLDQFFYGRYIRGALEAKVFIPTSKSAELVLRGAIGGGIPIGDSRILPREARFFTGGLNGMRGWPSNTLGPGRVSTTADLGGQDLVANGDTILATSNVLSSLSAPGGEYMVEFNAEYRFDFIPALYLELAFFTDLGNVWLSRGAVNALSPEDPSAAEKALLNPNNLSLGWDAGIGFRFDVSFLVIRVDLGQQLYSPALGDWVIKRDGLRDRRLFGETLRLNPSLAIGYPF
jgi:hypothetical protein